MPRHYPSTPKTKKNGGNNPYESYRYLNTQKSLFDSLHNPVSLQSEVVNNNFNQWKSAFCDAWENEQANVNAGNSLMQHSHFQIERMPYVECAQLGTDDTISRAIEVISNELFKSGGRFISKTASEEQIKALEDRLLELDFWKHMQGLVKKSLVFGGAFLYIDTEGSAKTSEPLYHNPATLSSQKVQALKVVEPWLCGAVEINAINPLRQDYMRPSLWFVSGSTDSIHSSRLKRLVFFEAPDIIKPIYNYLGISLSQFMKRKVQRAEVIGDSLSDLFLRFRTICIKTDSTKLDAEGAKSRAQAVNYQQNNLGMLLLSENESREETITPINGLEKIQYQAMENMAISARLPVTKLLGIEPGGLNSTGEFILQNFYDEMAGYQQNILLPVINDVAQMIFWSLGFEDLISYEFDSLKTLNPKEQAETDDAITNTTLKMYEAGMLTQEQAFERLKTLGVIGENVDLEAEEPLDFSEMGLNYEKNASN